jgi:hypothetical protein
VAEIAHTAARLMLAGRKSQEEVLEAVLCLHSAANQCGTQSRAEGILPRSQEAGLGAAKRLDSTVREDKMMANETEWPAMVAGRRSYGKCRIM